MAKNKLRVWLECATREELDKLAKLAKTSVGSIRQLAGAYRTDGVPHATPEAARNIELATAKMQREGLDPVVRESLCPACARCEYSKENRCASK